VGGGGTASVWAALDRQRGIDVAIKSLHAELELMPKSRMRFEREARVLGSLDHPHIARLLDHRLDGETPYFVLELLEGRTLADLIGAHSSSGTPIDLSALIRIFEQICSAVSHAHGRGILHRDLKPGNVMVDPTKVLDFGLAKLTDGPLDLATTAGRQIGSYFYMAPEQTYGQESTVASDVFGLGSILYEMLTLHRAWVKDASGAPLRAFAGDRAANSYNTPPEIMARIRRAPRPRPSELNPELEPFDAPVLRALAIDRRERYPSVTELLEEVRAAAGLDDTEAFEVAPRAESGASTLLDDPPSRRWWWWVAAAVFGASAAAVLWLW
jgi:serine/threonine-protein kinase